ncbi:MAG: phospholipid carrier-dependent glycosyltransferase, partial [Okeania sp. SIO3B3]|nr:phospholipid carrier-dependent glycosyltransferase [Okeania sp. SIO3B3]
MTPLSSNQSIRLYDRPFVLAAVTFLIALWPLLADLDTFVGPDEFTWVYRSAEFTEGLRTGDLSQTYQAGHPGITLMWMQAIGAGLRYYHATFYGPAEWTTFIAAERSITMLSQMREVNGVVYAGVLVMIVLLTQRVFGSGVAWLTGFLLAFDPFALTELRALRTEGTVTIFNMLGLVGLLLYVQRRRIPALVLSGVLVGLAILSKVPSLALGPAGLLAIGWLAFSQTERPWRENLRQAFQHAAIWGVTILLTFYVGLPALWTAPVETGRRMYDWLAVRVIEGETGGNSFFLGEPIANAELGPRFYGLVLLYRTTPVLWFGIIALLLALITPARRWLREYWLPVVVIGVHILTLFAVIAPSRLNFDRYALPMFPPLSLLAVLGYVALWRWFITARPDWSRVGAGAATLILAGQSLSAIPYHPYYQTYWNPVLGGISQAVTIFPVGIAGEGIDQVADYLNTLPDADTLTLASANSGKISPLLNGDTIPMTNIDGKWIQADYAFLYLSQIQRDKQDEAIITYLRRHPALHTVTLAGLEYAWVYPAPSAQFYGGASLLEGHGSLYGYDLSQSTLTPGEALTVTLYWRKEGHLPGDAPFVRLTDADSYIWAETIARPRPEFETVPRENMVESDALLTIPLGMV